ncbi:unnamed protein product [Candidula unifasciata]|uniref:Uncharacterized protein n=1 Tax=Candidula unifasciata TaxID=100452 RepID=A0A8S4A3I4_9EUPU|nr:unnamed protein product [Candidula unifasciata]
MSSVHAPSFDIMRPPKPPCWRDFVLSTSKGINFDGLDISEQTERMLAARAPVQDVVEPTRVAVSLPGSRLSRLARRPRARIHRTRSEHVIQAEDLPESEFTATLANTDPKGLRGLVPDGRLYVEENNRRCQNWLASIEAAEPLDKVDYTTDQQASLPAHDAESLDIEKRDMRTLGTKDMEIDCLRQAGNYLIPIYESQQGVDVEVPEETFVWSTVANTRQQSPSLREESCSPSREIKLKEENNKISGKLHDPQTLLPVNSKRLDNSVAQNSSCEGSSTNLSSRVFKCGKISCGKKLYKLCCDYEDAASSSWRDADIHGDNVNGVVDNKNHTSQMHIQGHNASIFSSPAPSKSRPYSRSSSLPSAT